MEAIVFPLESAHVPQDGQVTDVMKVITSQFLLFL